MSPIFDLLLAAVGIAVGAIVMWLLMRTKASQVRDAARLESEAERRELAATLANAEARWNELRNELVAKEQQVQFVQQSIAAEIEKRATLEARVTQIPSLLSEIAAKETQLQTLRDRLAAEIEDRSTAEEKAKRLPLLEQEVRERTQKNDALTSEIGDLRAQLAEVKTTLDKERRSTLEKIEVLEQTERRLNDTFAALSSKALQSNNQSFLDLAKSVLGQFQESAKGDLEKRQQAIQEIVSPVRESLDKVDVKIQELEKNHAGTYSSLTEQIKYMLEAQGQLKKETTNLVRALRAPSTRGRWGEIQLKRVVEMAGMVDHCDFYEQQSVNTESGALRPDMIVRLPGEKSIIVDAKAPLGAYLEALEVTDDDSRAEKLKDHSRLIRKHISDLGKKSYWENFQPTPEFVVLFLPGESFLYAALERDPELIEMGVKEKVLLATPTTLIAILRGAAYGWRQESIAKNAREISELGKELYKRLSDLTKHIADLGKHLSRSVESYNSAIGTMESRVLVSGRRFKELGAGQPDITIPELTPLDHTTRKIQSSELLSVSGDADLPKLFD